MKILYLITSTRGHGQGGHAMSLKTISETMVAIGDVCILCIGVLPLAIFRQSNVKTEYIFYNGKKTINVIRDILHKINEVKPDIIHSFDTRALFFARIAALRYRLPLVHTKAGGPNPTRWYPFAKTLICFSKENYDYFRAQPKFRKTALHLIPNRAVEPPEDPARVAEVRALAKGAPVLMRIARIGNTYAESFRQTIRLSNELTNRGARHALVLVGVVEDQPVLEELKKMAQGLEVHFLTDSHFTLNAAELVPAADLVVGTGRSIQEAASKGKVLLTPLAGSAMPVLVNKENVEALMVTNFSPRNVLIDYSEQQTIAMIAELTNDSLKRKEYSHFSKKFFIDHFDIRSALPRYEAIYRVASFSMGCWIGDLLHGLITTVRAFDYDRRQRDTTS